MEPAVHYDTEKQLIKVLPAQAGPTHAEQPSIPAFATEQQTMQILPAQVGLNQAEHSLFNHTKISKLFDVFIPCVLVQVRPVACSFKERVVS